MNTLTTVTETSPCFRCCFCRSGLVDDINLGQLFLFEGIVTHYFCMLFSAALSQHGRDDEGILGFLPQDIMTEVRRSLRLRCTYCSSSGASVGCCNKRCRTAFHFPCGLKNGANFQFFGNYESYCPEHIMYPKILLPKKDCICPICTSVIQNRYEALQSSCCKSAVFHRECLQKLALSSGYFFKCPMCNNRQDFVHEMRSMGIFVPEQDASWEREPNAYEDLYYQHSQCDVSNCLCPKGPTYSAQKGSWILARCRICGAAGTHKQCSNLSTVDNWACEICLAVEQRTEKEKQAKQVTTEKVQKPKPKKQIKVAVADKNEQEVYVSARSGNRKVRNGRLQKHKYKKSWKLSDIVVSPWCFWFFPYDKIRLEQFDSQSTLPDWRRLYLRVNLVNWIPKSIFEGGIDETVKQNQDTIKTSLRKSETISEEEDRALISDSEIMRKRIPNRKSLKFRKRVRRKPSWSHGIIRKNYKNYKKKLSALAQINKTNSLQHQADGTVIPSTSQSVLWNILSPNDEVPDHMQVPTTDDIIRSKNDPVEAVGIASEGLWLNEDFQIDIQSSVEIPSDETESQKPSSSTVTLLSSATVGTKNGASATNLSASYGITNINRNDNWSNSNSVVMSRANSVKDGHKMNDCESESIFHRQDCAVSDGLRDDEVHTSDTAGRKRVSVDENENNPHGAFLLQSKQLHAPNWKDHPYCKTSGVVLSSSMNSSFSNHDHSPPLRL